MESSKTAFPKNNTAKLVLLALLFAIALVLAALENTLPPLPLPFPGLKLGLSNIAIMYALFFLNFKSAFALAALKSGFVFLTRGALSGAISLSGGLLSVLAMIGALRLFKTGLSYMGLSILGAVFHNLGQLFVVGVIYGLGFMPLYLAVLLPFGAAAGILTATLLKALLPALNRAVCFINKKESGRL